MKEVKTNNLPKTKKSFFTKKKTILAALIFTLGNLFALSSATFAWFALSTQTASTMQTVAGDLDVEIKKFSAYKYVFPYHNNSADFIDYDSVGQVKSYVIEDTAIETPTSLATVATFPLTTLTNKAYATSPSDAAIGSSKVYYEPTHTFNYYLMGDSTFTGVTGNEWSSMTATAFSRREEPTSSDSVIVSNVVVSCGAVFTLFDVHGLDEGVCNYFSYGTPTLTGGSNSRFVIVEPENAGDFPRLQCLKSGIYSFEYLTDGSGNYSLRITSTSRSDNAIIGSNLVDPTMITIDYRGSADHTLYPTIDDYLPDAIQNQNTMVVLDVELAYKNKNTIDVGLQIKREAQNARSIYGFTSKYETTDSYTYLGYVSEGQRNPLNASDFYSFYAEIAKEENKYATPTAAWTALHNIKTNAEDSGDYLFSKFQNDTEYDRAIDCEPNPKESTDSTIIPASASDNTYHIYVAIEYDYEYMAFFTNQERLGKTYYLDRDFSFYFTASQHLETRPVSPRPLMKGKED